MADLTVTATEVLPGTDAVMSIAKAGATITAGQVVYLDSSTGTVKLADANGGSLAIATIHGIALGGGASNQRIVVQTGGTVTIGASASVTEGMLYRLSVTAGGISPDTDARTSGAYTHTIGVGDGSNGIVLGISNNGQQTA